MVFNATFNNNSVISWWSFLLVEETASQWQTLSYKVVHLVLVEIRIQISGDRHWLHRCLKIQLPYDHSHDSPSQLKTNTYEKSADTNKVIRNRKCQTLQLPKVNKANNDLQNTTQKTKDWARHTHTHTHTLKPKMNSDAPNVQAGSVPLVAPVMLLLSQTG
jgi:hypothetical protein